MKTPNRSIVRTSNAGSFERTRTCGAFLWLFSVLDAAVRAALFRRSAQLDQSEIVALLGPRTDTSKFGKYKFVYWLGQERSLMPIDSEWLVIDISRTGVATEAKIVHD